MGCDVIEYSYSVLTRYLCLLGGALRDATVRPTNLPSRPTCTYDMAGAVSEMATTRRLSWTMNLSPSTTLSYLAFEPLDSNEREGTVFLNLIIETLPYSATSEDSWETISLCRHLIIIHSNVSTPWHFTALLTRMNKNVSNCFHSELMLKSLWHNHVPWSISK